MGTAAYDQVQVLETKDCIVCDRLIDVRSDTCPHCQAVQPTPPDRRSAFAPVLLAAITIAAVAYLVRSDPVIDPQPDTTISHSESEDAHITVSVAPANAVQDNVASGTVEPLIGGVTRAAQSLRECDAHWDHPICQESLAVMEQKQAELSELLNVDAVAYCATVRSALLELVGTSDPRTASLFNRMYENSQSCRNA